MRSIEDGLTKKALYRYPKLPYHNARHAMDVARDADAIVATMPDRTRRQLPSPFVLRQAALWHDAGYNDKTYERRTARSLEEYSASLAVEAIIRSRIPNALNIALGVKSLILCTEDGYDRSGIIGGIVLHQADIANMSSRYDLFLDANKRVYSETFPDDTAYEHWEGWIQNTAQLLDSKAPEVRDELRQLGVSCASDRAEAMKQNALRIVREPAPFVLSTSRL